MGQSALDFSRGCRHKRGLLRLVARGLAKRMMLVGEVETAAVTEKWETQQRDAECKSLSSPADCCCGGGKHTSTHSRRSVFLPFNLVQNSLPLWQEVKQQSTQA